MPAANTRPNILFIFTDQQRFDTIAELGNPVIKTPNLDRLVREGTAFASAYSTSPVCISARCSTIYGQYPMHTGCYENSAMPSDGRQSFMDALTAAGYRTHGIGKCHFSPGGRNVLRGFQTRQFQEEIVRTVQDDDYLPYLDEQGAAHVCEPHGVRGEMYYVPQPSQLPARLHPTNWVGDQSVKFIREQAGSGQSWYLYSSYIHPHPPFSPPSPWHKLYRAPMMPLPKLPQDYESLWTFINRHQNRYKYRDQGIDQNLLRNIKAYYYACISFVDFQVGRLLEALEQTGQLDNTLILYSSDHGELLGDYNCFGKRSMHDSCARIPMLARLPGRLPQGHVCTTPTSLVDIAPTILAASGATITSHSLDGVDLTDVANGSCKRPMVFAQHARAEQATYMAVSDKWKYFFSTRDNRDWLFDRVVDPDETRNRVGIRFMQDHRKAMQQALMDHLKSGGETFAIDGDQWKQFPPQQMPEDPDTGLLIQDQPWADTKIPGYTD